MAFNFKNIEAIFASNNPPPFIIIKAGPGHLYEEGTAAEAEVQGHRVTHTLTHSTIYPKPGHVASMYARELAMVDALRVLAAYPLEDFGMLNAADDKPLFGACEWRLTVGDVRKARKALGYKD